MDSKNLKELYLKSHQIYSQHKIRKQTRRKVKGHLNGKIMTKEQKVKVEEFYKPYKKITTNFHEFYYQKTGKFYENYLPDDLYYCDIDMYFNNWNIGQIVDNKCYYDRIFPRLKQPETFAVRINGFWYNNEKKLVPEKSILGSTKKEKQLFIKYASESAGGKGVFYINNDKNNIEEELKNIVISDNRDIVIQRALKQHKILALLNPSSVNTIRILSLLTEKGT